MSHPIVRFAPSPTGRIHIGNARPALLNFLFARKYHGEFILRFDDTDLERSKEEYAASIEVDLAWLGITPDRTLRQSQRFALYREAAEVLRSKGRLYPCYETAEELDRKRKRQQARGLPPIYDRAALALSEADRAKLEAEGRRPHWRFKLDPGIARWDDLIRGESHIDAASLSDPILLREDGSYLYTLPSVVDDIDCKITHVIRGEDHVTNTAVQIQLFEALAGHGHVPVFGHHNLLSSASGEGFSKRTGSLSIGSLRDQGFESLAVAAAAVLTGSSVAVHPVKSLDELVAGFDLASLSRTQARFDPAELANLSARTLHQLDFETVRDRLAAHDITGYKAKAFWEAVRGNLTVFLDCIDWWRVVEGEIPPVTEDTAFLDLAKNNLPEEPWDEKAWSSWTGRLKDQTGRKGKALFHPLRLALTGRETGPELAALLPLIGRLKATARLSGHVA
ncbi:glutamate--tRNA ligase [Beijerinckia indica]|uniref:Glutamate--tRNA ligase 2 n=1 Tax=Beijerinckia indica subsp. indica (strain ATCC 9039 / DSM 1715 / NCIMB 8712) TaxID=395963 RepID=SYE2_BEII9|nr:glutamate--tRNA ligase [Beijerinckia indica]B2IGY0.1 RecName: Full=Glutamate--tRNA ligase 2; AltName: Full=Glutamyl-tRNA synthetase 2; Short=GluRS 2 [Beijerinckia indica subsp. indica ATCC 9039]ACB97226.1 glutamyl-tRNA synthetase [Beijerinckia indica subsp. indica ATCC 9039]